MRNKSTVNVQINLWIEIALSDLIASNILYASKQYRNSYFLFHQSVEKANKAFALFSGKTEKDLFKYGHHQLNIYKAPLLVTKKDINEINNVIDIFPKAKSDNLFKKFNIQEYRTSIDKAITGLEEMHSADLINISLNDIRYLLDELYEIEHASIKLPKKSDMEFVETMREVVDWVQHFDTPETTAFYNEYLPFINAKENQEMLYKASIKVLKIVQVLSFVMLTFFICAVFTTQHGSPTRYPSEGVNPLKIYTKKLPLIHEQEQIMDIFRMALEKFKKALNTI